jgi:hypothetical protein
MMIVLITVITGSSREVIADELVRQIDEIEAAECNFVSQVGHLIGESKLLRHVIGLRMMLRLWSFVPVSMKS